MREVLWHGRGGQGAFTAARLLGAACCVEEGRYALAFPSFGPERRGAPMRAFTKASDAPIGDRSAIVLADYVIYLDDTLLDARSCGNGAWERELKDGGRVLVNSTQTYDDERIISIDADGISKSVLGRAIPNTVFLGALCALCDWVCEEQVAKAIRQCMPEKLHAKNQLIVSRACEHMRGRLAQSSVGAGDAVGDGVRSNAAGADAMAVADVEAAARVKAPEHKGSDRDEIATAKCDLANGASPHRAALSSVEAEVDQHEDAVPSAFQRKRPAGCIPLLREHMSSPASLDPAIYARSTCFQAGHLVARNAGWRSVRPVVDAQRCTGCMQCVLYCPDGTLYVAEDDATASCATAGGEGAQEGSLVTVDYDFCKGCGICAKMCRFGAIAMVGEKGAES